MKTLSTYPLAQSSILVQYKVNESRFDDIDNFHLSDINSKLDFLNDLSPGRNSSTSTRIAALE